MVILFTGFLFVVLGLISLFFATKLKPNYLVGYRSFQANSSQEAFTEANIYSGRIMIGEGIISFILSFFKIIPTKYAVIGGVIYFILLAIIMFIATEIHLKKKIGF